MANNFPPTVTILGANVQLGNSVLLSDLFTVDDIDPGSEVTMFRFSDRSTNPQTGRFFINDEPVQSGLVVELPWNLLHTVEYRSGAVISSELISVEVFDGLFWSQPGVGAVRTVQANVTIPVADGTDFSVLSQEMVNVEPFINAYDPDGYPILEYYFVDRDPDVHGSTLFFKGVEMPDAVWFPVLAEELQFLKVAGAEYGKTETISYIARDEAAWSEIKDITVTTTPNLINPEVVAINTSVTLGGTIPAAELYVFSDGDGNTNKQVGFREQGGAPSSGFFTNNGVPQPAGEWFWVDAGNIGDVAYVSGSTISLEQFEVQVFDGQRLSGIGVADVSTVDVPSLSTGVLQMIDTLEQVLFANQISFSSGVSPLFYEIIDMNPAATSAKLVVNGNELDGGEIHTISANDFALTFIKGGLDDLGRSLDEFMIRIDNGNAKSAWKGVNFSTDPVNQAALLDIGSWDHQGPTVDLTFNFPATPPAYLCTLGFDECDDFTPMTDPAMRAAVRSVLASYEDYFNLTYTEVASTELSDVPFALSDAVPDSAAYTRSPGNPGFPGTPDPGADIFGTTSQLASISQSDPGDFGYYTWIHENGHAVGLDHPFGGGGQGGAPPHLPPALDNNMYSVMSYTTAYSHLGQPIYPVSPMLYDVMAIQTLYGANPNFQAGNTQIKFDPMLTYPQVIYDANGADTFNLNNHTANAVINLNEGQFSSVTGIENNIAIAWGTVIENARGGKANDTIIGNELPNSLIGNLGDDVLRGGGGVDFLHGGEGRDTYEWFIGDENDHIDERFGAGRDTLAIHLFDEYVFDNNGTDPLGGTTLLDNFEFLRSGNDLEVRLTLDGIADNGTLTIQDMGWGRQRVETLKIYDFAGDQVGPDISLLSIFEFSTSTSTPFEITSNTSNYGNLALPAS